VIRLWQRVGIFRALSACVLLGSATGGLVLSDRQTQQHRVLTTVDSSAATPSTFDADAESRQLIQYLREQRDLAARQEAQAKADEAARAAAADAERAADEARKNAAAARSSDRTAKPSATATVKPSPTVKAAPPAPKVVIPPDCSAYTGNRAIGCALVRAAGLGMDQMSCLDKLFTKESNWRTTAANPSGAYGIPQSLPGSKMASVGADWRTNPSTQIKWGLGYIKGRYGTPCKAWAHSQARNWY